MLHITCPASSPLMMICKCIVNNLQSLFPKSKMHTSPHVNVLHPIWRDVINYIYAYAGYLFLHPLYWTFKLFSVFKYFYCLSFTHFLKWFIFCSSFSWWLYNIQLCLDVTTGRLNLNETFYCWAFNKKLLIARNSITKNFIFWNYSRLSTFYCGYWFIYK